MAKFAINRPRAVRPVRRATQTSLGLAISKASPLTHALAEYIMSAANKEAASESQNADQVAINKLFKSFPNDQYTTRLAQLTEVLTGIKPAYSNATYEIGQVVRCNSGIVWAIVYTNGQYAYGINASSNGYKCFGPSYETGARATLAEAGLFAKAVLGVSGITLLQYVNTTLGIAAGTQLLKALKLDSSI